MLCHILKLIAITQENKSNPVTVTGRPRCAGPLLARLTLAAFAVTAFCPVN